LFDTEVFRRLIEEFSSEKKSSVFLYHVLCFSYCFNPSLTIAIPGIRQSFQESIDRSSQSLTFCMIHN